MAYVVLEMRHPDTQYPENRYGYVVWNTTWDAAASEAFDTLQEAQVYLAWWRAIGYACGASVMAVWECEKQVRGWQATVERGGLIPWSQLTDSEVGRRIAVYERGDA